MWVDAIGITSGGADNGETNNKASKQHSMLNRHMVGSRALSFALPKGEGERYKWDKKTENQRLYLHMLAAQMPSGANQYSGYMN